MSAATPPPSRDRGWLEPLLWSAGLLAAMVGAACYNAEVREILTQGVAYLFTFLTTPFVLEATVAFVGLMVVFIINSRRIAREGDGWVVMEIKSEDESPEKTKENGV